LTILFYDSNHDLGLGHDIFACEPTLVKGKIDLIRLGNYLEAFYLHSFKER